MSGKSADIFVWYTTFERGDYSQDRHSSRHEWRSCYWLNAQHRVCGLDHRLIGCAFDSSLLRLVSGTCLQNQFPSGGSRPAAENTGIVECAFSNGGEVEAGFDGGNVKVRGTYARGNSGYSVTINTSYNVETSIANGASQGDWCEAPVPLTTAEVGRGATDPLVPPGYS